MTPGLKNAQSRLTQLQRSGETLGKGIRQVGTGFTQLGTRAAVVAAGGLTAVVKTAIDFETAWTGVTKTVEGTPEQLEELNEGFRELARTIPLSFEEFAAIGEQAGALGIARQDILAFTEVVAQIGTTTDVSSEAAATALGQLGNVLNLTGEDFDNFGAALVDLGNKGASTESQILEITRRFGATGAQAGLTAQEVLAFSSAAANLGLQSELAGGALQRFFIRTQKFVQSNDINLENMAKTAGLTKKAFADLFAEDAAAAILKFVQGMEKLDKAERAAMLASLEFSNQTGLNQLLSGLTANSDNLAQSLETSAKGWEENTALTKEAEKRYATTASKLEILKNNVRDAANTIGSQLLPVIADLSSELVEFINQPDTQRKIKEFAENLGKGARDLVKAFKAGEFQPFIDSLKGAAGVAKLAFDAFNALPGPIKQVAIAAALANRATGGAVGLIASGAANIFKGLLGLGSGLLSRGSPTNPMFTKEIGITAGGGLLGAGGPGGLRGIIGTISKIAVPLAIAVMAAEGLTALVEILDPGFRERKEQFRRENPLFGGRPEGAATPIGQFDPANRGGTVPVKVTNKPLIDPVVFRELGAKIDKAEERQTNALRAGDIHRARLLERNIEGLHQARGSIRSGFNDVIPKLGLTNRALSLANRNLDEGNRRQREIADRVREARERIGSGFARSHEIETGILRKPSSFTANVTVPVTTYVSYNQALSVFNRSTAIIHAGSSGFQPGL